jgi:hypothetical protein
MNRYAPKKLQGALGKGGSYLRMEDDWEKMLETGVRIRVVITDRYRLHQDRPFTRNVRWWTIERGHNEWTEMPTIDFGNFSSPQEREARAIKADR